MVQRCIFHLEYILGILEEHRNQGPKDNLQIIEANASIV